MPIHFRDPRVLLSIILVAASAGCISPAVHKQVPAFANAVTLATENTKSAFDVVEQEFETAQTARIVVDYDQKGFKADMVRPFLRPDDLQVRLDLLNALQEYASKLSDVSSDKQLDQFDEKTRAFGSSLQDLSKTDAFSRFAKNDPNIAASAVNALGHWFIEDKRQKQLPKIIGEMQEPVKKTAELLQADIGKAPDQEGHGGSGLRDELWDAYSNAILQQDTFIKKYGQQLGPLDKAEAVRTLPRLVRQRELADKTLQQTQSTLAKLVDAHTALLKAVQSKGDIQAELSVLISEGQRIKAFYDSLQKKD
jgi:hypothetical protein